MRDTEAMKERVKQGYDGAYSDHVSHYDEVGTELQLKSAAEQLKDIDLRGKTVLDIGGGTGVASLLMLRNGAAIVTCGDISELMLSHAHANAEREGFGPDRIQFRQLDAEALPFEDDTFDVVSTSMTMGLLPDQRKATAEMARVARPGGLVTIGTHAPEHYWEPIDASLRAMHKRFLFGYRLEFWPRSEWEVRVHAASPPPGHTQSPRDVANRFRLGRQGLRLLLRYLSLLVVWKTPTRPGGARIPAQPGVF